MEESLSMKRNSVNGVRLIQIQLLLQSCGDKRQEAFKHLSDFKDTLCHRDHAKRVVAKISHQIQYEYYGEFLFISLIIWRIYGLMF